MTRPYLMNNGRVEFRTRRNENVICSVEPTIDESDYAFLVPEENLDELTGQMVTTAVVDTIAKGNYINEQFKSEERQRLYQSYLDDIDTQMMAIYGTKNPNKAASLFLTWREWKMDPSFFSDKSLADEYGNALDEASKISIYATQKIDQAKDYSVFLLKREQQYKDALALLEA